MYLKQELVAANPLLHQFLNESDTRPLSDEELKELYQQENFNQYLVKNSLFPINLVTLICMQGMLAPLRELVSRAPDDSKKMIEQSNYWAFQCAAANGHLPILQYLAEQLPDKLQAMIEADNYFAFQWAAKNGHLPILQYLAEQLPDKLQAMIEASITYHAFQWAATNKHYTAVHFILEKADGIDKELFNTLIKQLTLEQKKALNTLSYESSIIHYTLFKDNLPKELIECIKVSSNLFPFFKPVRECLADENTNKNVFW